MLIAKAYKHWIPLARSSTLHCRALTGTVTVDYIPRSTVASLTWTNSPAPLLLFVFLQLDAEYTRSWCCPPSHKGLFISRSTKELGVCFSVISFFRTHSF